MSLQTWKDEFYPEEPRKRMTKRQAIEHSIRKWEGLTTENLKKHGCYVDDGYVKDYSNIWFGIDGKSCALCRKYYKDEAYDESDCYTCPLYNSLGHKCDSIFHDDAPYYIWVETKNPVPMINALKELLK